MKRPELTFAPDVSAEHAETFTDRWFEESLSSTGIGEAFAATGLILWPDDEAAQERYRAIRSEILTRTLAAVKPAVVGTFLRIAREVRARESA